MTSEEEAIALTKMNLGMANAVLEDKPNSLMGQLLLSLARDVTEQLRASVDKHKINASSNLKQSIKPSATVVNDNGVVSVAVNADFYWKFVNYGVNGDEVNHGAPSWGVQPRQDKSFHQAILEWIPTTGTTSEDYDSFAWAIMNKIKRDGKAPRPFYTDVVNDHLKKELIKPIKMLLKNAIEVKIIDPWQ